VPESAIEVVYALAGRQRVVSLRLAQPMSAEEAVRASGLLEEFPGLAGQPLALGIFGRRVDGRHVLRAGDRVEIYRPLKVDPREARRASVQSGGRNKRTRGR
jgi:putative ubiquitin-RnfH superfamily antitoxin RatB of RatAB toxin-antitoxin module